MAGQDPHVPLDCDVAVVGAGIIALAAARELARRQPRLRIVILEKEPAVAAHQTGHNSGVVHAGLYYTPGSLKARLCVDGARMLYDYCAEKAIPVERCGKLIIATRADEIAALETLHERARANRVAGVRRIAGGEIPEYEPHARGLAALHSPATGIVDFGRVAQRLAEGLTDLGHVIALNTEVLSVERRRIGVEVVHGSGRLRARAVLACAGLWADRLAVASGAPADPRIVPFRGAYLLLAPHRRHLVRGLIYPVPDPRLPFLGVHLTRHTDGEVSIGPTALLVAARDAYRLRRVRLRDALETLAWPGTRRMAWRFRQVALHELVRAVAKARLVGDAAQFVPELSVADVVRGGAGVRAQAVARDGSLVDDFVISETASGLHVRNAPSPAATASLAIAREIVDRFERRLSV